MPKTSKASKTAAARRARLEDLQRTQKAQEQRRVLIAAGAVGLVVIVIAVVLVVTLTRGGGGSGTETTFPGLKTANEIIPAGVSGATVTQQPPKRVPNKTGIPGVLAWDTEGWPGDGQDHPGALEHTHVYGPVKYAVTPPVGGPHNPTWMNAGVYTKPIPPERAVHNLEHGAVWITYNPDLPRSQIRVLLNLVSSFSLIPEPTDQTSPDQANRFIDMSPWSSNDLPAPIVLSSWGYQLRVNNPSDPRLKTFIDTFRVSRKYTPEYGPEVDGVPVQTGGRPAGDGSKEPNPSGVLPQQ